VAVLNYTNVKQLLLALMIMSPFIYGIAAGSKDMQLVGGEVIGVCAGVWIGFGMRGWVGV
jgi:hypothetical protein